MKNNEWTLFIVTDTGREVPHWSASTRQACREMKPTLSKGVRTKIKRVQYE